MPENSSANRLTTAESSGDYEDDVNRRLARVWRDSRLGPTVEHLRRHILRDGEQRIEVLQYRLLHALAENGPMSMRTLAGAVGSAQSSISRTIARLETDGLVQRQQSTTDQRSFTVSLTEPGHEVHDSLIERAFGTYEEIFAVFSLEERQDLAILLERLLKSADATLAAKLGPPQNEGS